jgi:hypothetical protein
VSLLGIGLLYATLYKLELTAKHTRAQLRALRRLTDIRSGADGGEAWVGRDARTGRSRSAAPTLLGATRMTARAGGGGGS